MRWRRSKWSASAHGGFTSEWIRRHLLLCHAISFRATPDLAPADPRAARAARAALGEHAGRAPRAVVLLIDVTLGVLGAVVLAQLVEHSMARR